MTTTGIIQSVSMNSSGVSLIGGQEHDQSTGFTPAYAAIVSSSGAITPLTITGLPAIHGIIYSVAINNSGNGIIGGQAFFNALPAYAALVSSSGVMTPLTLTGGIDTTGQISSVSINSSGNGLIGGQDQN
jgi:hypothetical protein